MLKLILINFFVLDAIKGCGTNNKSIKNYNQIQKHSLLSKSLNQIL